MIRSKARKNLLLSPEETESTRPSLPLEERSSPNAQLAALMQSPDRLLDRSPFKPTPVRTPVSRNPYESPADTLEYSVSEEPTEGQPRLTTSIMEKFPYIPTDSLEFSDDEPPAIRRKFENGGTPKRLERSQSHSIQAIRKHFNLQSNGGLRSTPGESILSTQRLSFPTLFEKSDASCACHTCALF